MTRGENRPVAAATRFALVVAAVAAGWPATAVADDCPNAAFRTGPSASLPDCRAWERVSPADKNGQAVLGAAAPAVRTAIGGGGAFYVSTGPIDRGSQASPYFLSNLATRSASGWTSRSIDVRNTIGLLKLDTTTVAVSEDLSRAVVVSRRALTPGAIDLGTNVYLQDTRTGELTLVAAKASDGLNEEVASLRPASGTPDFSTFVIPSTRALEPGSSDDTGQLRFYRWSNGALQRLGGPIGDPAAPPFLYLSDGPAARPISNDATRVTLTSYPASGDSSVYQIDGARTRVVSHTQADPATPASGFSPVASGDGSRVTFASDAALTDASRPDSPSLYQWSAADGSVTDLLATATGAGDTPLAETLPANMTVLHVGEGSPLVWFYAEGSVIDGDGGGLYVLDTDTDRVVRVGEASSIPANFRFSPDSSNVVYLFTSEDRRQVASFDYTPPAGADPSLGRGPFCATCGVAPASDAQPSVGPAPGGTTGLLGISAMDDGRVFFSTSQPLSPADVNRAADVYQSDPYTYRAGNVTVFAPSVQLLTAGTGDQDASLAGLSPDGRDLFVISGPPLVAGDTDDQVDLYTARVDGGLADQQLAPTASAPCRGEGCLPAAVPVPAGSAAPPTSGDVPGSPPALPRFAVTTPSASALRGAARNGRLTVKVGIGAAGTVSGGLRATVGGKDRTVASRTVKASRPQTVSLALRLSRAARRKLARERRLTLRLGVAYSERTERVRKTIRLNLPKQKGGRR